jgi:hypothetical protein
MERKKAPTTKQQPYVKFTVYVTGEQRKALRIRAATEEREISELVRDALDRYLREK